MFTELNQRKELIIEEFKEFLKKKNIIRFEWFGKEGNSIIEELEQYNYVNSKDIIVQSLGQ